MWRNFEKETQLFESGFQLVIALNETIVTCIK